MIRHTGKDLYVAFAGTPLTGDQTRFTITIEQGLEETTTTADADRTYIATLADAAFKLEILERGTAGTAMLNAVRVGGSGTLLWGPLGTAAGNPKGGAFAIVTANEVAHPYDDVAIRTIRWQRSGAFVFDETEDTW